MKRRNFIQIIAGATLVLTNTIRLKAAEIIKKVTTPPGSVSLANLLDNCIKCNECINSCPNEVLQPSIDQYGKNNTGIPYLDFSTNFCNYTCNTCSTVCPNDAIIEQSLKKKQITQIGIAEFNQPRCIVVTGKTSCGACAEVCPTSAITMKNIGNNLEIPEINRKLCIGCGACEYACPVETKDAIYANGLKIHLKAVSIESKIIDKPVKGKSGKTFAF